MAYNRQIALERIANLKASLQLIIDGGRPDAIVRGGATGIPHAPVHAGARERLNQYVNVVADIASSGSTIGSSLASAGLTDEEAKKVNSEVDVKKFRTPIMNEGRPARGIMAADNSGLEEWMETELDKVGATSWDAFKQTPELTEKLGLGDSRYQVGIVVWRTGMYRPDLTPEDLKDPVVNRELALKALNRKLPIHQMEEKIFPMDFDGDLKFIKDQLGPNSVAKVNAISSARVPLIVAEMFINPETHEVFAAMDGATLRNQPTPFNPEEVPPVLVIDIRAKDQRDKQIDKLQRMSRSASPWDLTLWVEGGKYNAMDYNMAKSDTERRYGLGGDGADEHFIEAAKELLQDVIKYERQIDHNGLLGATPERNIAGQVLSLAL